MHSNTCLHSNCPCLQPCTAYRLHLLTKVSEVECTPGSHMLLRTGVAQEVKAVVCQQEGSWREPRAPPSYGWSCPWARRNLTLTALDMLVITLHGWHHHWCTNEWKCGYCKAIWIKVRYKSNLFTIFFTYIVIMLLEKCNTSWCCAAVVTMIFQCIFDQCIFFPK